MTAPRPCLCPPAFIREPGRHLVGCPHAPGDTVAPARNVLERPPVVDPQPAPATPIPWDQPGADPFVGIDAFLRDSWRTIHAGHLEAETHTAHPDRAAVERLGRVFGVPLAAFAPELCTPADLEAWHLEVEARARTLRGRWHAACRWLATGPAGRARQRARFARFARFDLLDALARRRHR